MLEVRATLKIGHCWIYRILNLYVNNVVNIRSRYDPKRKVVTDIVELYLMDNVEVSELIDVIMDSPNILGVEVLNHVDGKVLLKVDVVGCPLYSILEYETHNYFKEEYRINGDILLTLYLRKAKRLKYVIERIMREVKDSTFKDIKIYRRRYSMTTNQETAIRVAYELGYFDIPRKISLKKLGKILGMAPSTLNEVLRRGEKKIIEYYFRNKDRLEK